MNTKKIRKQTIQNIKKEKKEKKPFSKRTVIIVVVIVLFILLILFFVGKANKANIFGNTTISKSAEDLTANILNMSSYEATIVVEVQNNKNQTKYLLKQQYVAPNIGKQQVLEPENIKDLKMSYDGSTLKLENTRLNLNSVFENYQYLAENNLFLSSFVEDYKANSNSQYKEKNNEIIMQTNTKETTNKYAVYKKLHIDKNTGKPSKLEIQDGNKNTLVYIKYNEIKINSTSKEEVFAFRIEPVNIDI